MPETPTERTWVIRAPRQQPHRHGEAAEGEDAPIHSIADLIRAGAAEAGSKRSFSDLKSRAAITSLGIPDDKQYEIPPEREVTYLVIDNSILHDPRSREPVAQELRLLASARDFHITEDDERNMVVVAFSERGGLNKLLAISKSITQAVPESRMLIKSGIISREADGFSLTSYPDGGRSADWRSHARSFGIYISSELAGKVADPQSRLGSNVEIAVRELEGSSLLALTDHAIRTTLERGGPSRLVGNADKMEQLTNHALRVPQTRFIVLKGDAGMGKSRLLRELLEKHPSHVLCSMDASDKNILGSGLITLTDQLVRLLQEEAKHSDEPALAMVSPADIASSELDDSDTTKKSIYLDAFSYMPNAQKIGFAAAHPRTVADLCVNALIELNKRRSPGTLFALEDLHHADSISEKALINVARKYMQATRGKALISMRPQEVYESADHKKLEAELGTGANEITVEGIDFKRKPELAREFALYSLPMELQRHRLSGVWPEILGEIAGNSPWKMKTLMDAVLERDPDSDELTNLVVSEQGISIKPELLERLQRIDPRSDDDFTVYLHERVGRLTHDSRQALQCIALMGGKVSEEQIMIITGGIVHFTEIVRELRSKGHLIIDENQVCRLQHDNIREIAISSIPSEAEKVRLATDLFTKFRSQQNVSAEAKHSLLTIIAGSPTDSPSPSDKFWQQYRTTLDEALAEAGRYNNTELGYKVSSDTLNCHDIEAAVQALMEDGTPQPPTTIRAIIIQALTAKAENARFLGKFDDVDEAVTALKEIHRHYPTEVNITRAHVVRFDAAYANARATEMATIYDKDLQQGKDLHPAMNALLQIKLLYRQGRFDEAMEVFAREGQNLKRYNEEYTKTHSTPLPEMVEIIRIARARLPHEKNRHSVIHPTPDTTFDQDIVMQSRACTDAQLAEFRRTKAQLDKIRELTEHFPLIVDRSAQLNILDQYGELAAFLGNHEEAITTYQELWRLAMKGQRYNQAARAAKKRGDIELMLATQQEPAQKKESILRALKTYCEEGGDAVSNMGKNAGYRRLLAIAKIRAIGLLVQEHDPMQPPSFPGIEEELTPHLQMAVKELTYLNEDWPQTATDTNDGPEFCYDISGYAGYILKAIKELKLRKDILPRDIESHKLLRPEAIASGIQKAEKMVDNGLGEKQRKTDGLHLMQDEILDWLAAA